MSDDPELDAREAERQRMAGLYKAIFEDDRRGEAVLADLAQRFARGPAHGFTPEAITETFVNAHQRKVFDFIYLMINKANGVDDEPPTTERQSDESL